MNILLNYYDVEVGQCGTKLIIITIQVLGISVADEDHASDVVHVPGVPVFCIKSLA